MKSEALPLTQRFLRSTLAWIVQSVIISLVSFWSGFFTVDFLLSGLYTWPRTSRMLALTLAVIILAHEFVYKEQRVLGPADSPIHSLKMVWFFCVVPYMLGTLVLLAILSWN